MVGRGWLWILGLEVRFSMWLWECPEFLLRMKVDFTKRIVSIFADRISSAKWVPSAAGGADANIWVPTNVETHQRSQQWQEGLGCFMSLPWGQAVTLACFSPRTTPSPCTSSRAGGTNAWHTTTFLSTWPWTIGWLTSCGCLTPISWTTRSPFCMEWPWRIAWSGSILMGLSYMAWGKSEGNSCWLWLWKMPHLNFLNFKRDSGIFFTLESV